MVVLTRPDGQRQVFYSTDPAASDWLPIWQSDARLYRLEEPVAGETDANGGPVMAHTGWRYEPGTGMAEIFDAEGKLLRLESPTGNVVTLVYTAGQLATVTDRHGRTLSFQYNNGELVGLTDPAGKSIAYGYNPAGLAGQRYLPRCQHPPIHLR